MSTNDWQPMSEDELGALVETQLSRCAAEDRSFFERIRIPFRRISLARGKLREDVFAVAQSEDKIVYYDDVEGGFEVGMPDADGVLHGCGQFELCHALAQMRHGSR